MGDEMPTAANDLTQFTKDFLMLQFVNLGVFFDLFCSKTIPVPVCFKRNA